MDERTHRGEGGPPKGSPHEEGEATEAYFPLLLTVGGATPGPGEPFGEADCEGSAPPPGAPPGPCLLASFSIHGGTPGVYLTCPWSRLPVLLMNEKPHTARPMTATTATTMRMGVLISCFISDHEVRGRRTDPPAWSCGPTASCPTFQRAMAS